VESVAQVESAAPSDPLDPLPLIAGAPDDEAITRIIFQPVWEKTRRGWWLLFLIGLGGVGLLVTAVTVTLAQGIGAWGNNIPVGWAFGIVNFVWWIGIGHAGTLISAILLLFQQKWRTSINRFAEAMTLFAVMCAGMFPVLHLGRPWFAYWLFPYPNRMDIWPQFRSALTWDVAAVSTYFTVSLLFWYVGLVPDLAALRDASKSRLQRIIYGIFSLGWRGSGRQWHHYRIAYLLLGGLATPLVVSVHTIVSFDFAEGLIPGWHSTIFPPYFVAGAVFSGFALVLTLMIPARRFMGLEQVITLKHIDNMNKVLLATSMMVGYGYVIEQFMGWYSGNIYELYSVLNRMFGPYAIIFWLLILCNVLVPQVMWSRRIRTNLMVTWIVSLLVNVGMWCERFMIVVVSMHRDFLPSSWAMYRPTWVDISLFTGTLAFFGTLFLLFLRFLPAVSATEVKELRQELSHQTEVEAA
jgi:molybdopterin-containing oxidoreductase family membrane subunit